MLEAFFIVSCLVSTAQEQPSVQVPRWVVAQADSLAPVWLMEKNRNVMGSAKLGGNVEGIAHVAAGVQGVYLPSELSATMFSGIAAGLGELKATSSHLSLAIGLPTYEIGALDERPFSVVTLTGNLRLVEQVTLMSEHWVFVSAETSQTPHLQHSVTLRVNQDRTGLAAGMLVPQYARFPMPWLSASYRF